MATTVCLAWFAGAAAMFGLFLPVMHLLPGLLMFALWLAGGFGFIYVPYAIVSFYREGGMLAVTADGITFPPALLGLGPHKSLQWGDLKTINYSEIFSRLQLHSESGGDLSIDTNKVPQTEVEQLLLAIEVFSPKAIWSQSASDFKDELQNAKMGISSDFTHMWEAELKRRYSVTTFAPHQPGTQLQSGRLTILKQLAFGGFSAVYLAEDEERQKVVVKELVINCDSADSHRKAVEMFDREAKLLARVSHSNIARVIDHFVEENRHYLVLEYIDGENLREIVARKGRLDEETVIDLSIRMTDILEYLHGLEPPLLHRDFTPDNLLLTAGGELMLVDFGAANECASAVTGTLVGKQSYMPIEQIRGKAEPRSDLYALGCTMYYLLTGTDPEPLSTISTPGVSEKLRQVIERLTQMEPGDRFPAASQVRLILSELSQPAGSIVTARKNHEHYA
jgi:predicted Ser/Thr protein kinase